MLSLSRAPSRTACGGSSWLTGDTHRDARLPAGPVWILANDLCCLGPMEGATPLEDARPPQGAL